MNSAPTTVVLADDHEILRDALGQVLTRDLRNARLVEFVEYAPKVDEDDLARMTRRGAVAWKDVADATAWVDELRGGSQ